MSASSPTPWRMKSSKGSLWRIQQDKNLQVGHTSVYGVVQG
jgi:hypothetical protein